MSTTHEELQQPGEESSTVKPYPWRCPKCLQKTVSPVVLTYRAKASHDGRLYEFDVPELQISRCAACGELVFTNHANEQISNALRSHLRLLAPLQIQEARQRLGLLQNELTERLGTTEETLGRWEEGTLIQPRALDNLLRVFFALPEVRSVLTGTNQYPTLGVDANRANTK